MYNLYNKEGNAVLNSSSIKEILEYIDKNPGYSMRVGRWVSEEDKKHYVVWLCVNKQLEPYNLTYFDVSSKGNYKYLTKQVRVKKEALWGLFSYHGWEEAQVNWYQYFTFKTEEDFQEWKAFCISNMKKILGLNKQFAEKSFDWLNLQYGLKQEYASNKAE